MPWLSKLSLATLLLLLLSGGAQGEELRLTGERVTAEFIDEVARSRGLVVPGLPNRPLRPGDSWSWPGGQEFKVSNIDWRSPRPAVAALSDHPEKVTRRGMLFSGGLTINRPVRFQYYHLGLLPGRSPHLDLLLVNPSRQKVLVHTIRGIGTPSLNYFATGHQNNVRWFERYRDNLGEFIVVPPFSTVVLQRQELPFDKVVSGLIQMTIVDGPPLNFYLIASPNSADPIALNNLLDEHDVHSRGFYPVAEQQLSRIYRVGDADMNIPIGAVRQQTFAGVRELRGDYGVSYRLQLHLENPTRNTAQIEFFFNPRGGVATATFLVDGSEIVEVSQTKAFDLARFTTVVLEPGERRSITLETIPEGASSYPIRVVLKSADTP